MSMIGHNRGPSMEAGFAFRKLSWTKARTDLLPTLPLEVVRLRVARAKRLGLNYKTYATIRATTGRDIVGFLFSSNALALHGRRVALPQDIAARLTDLPAKRIAAVYRPLHPDTVQAANNGALDLVTEAPDFLASWGEMRSQLTATIRAGAVPSDGVVVVAATAVETEWCGAANMAGTLRAAEFFTAI